MKQKEVTFYHVDKLRILLEAVGVDKKILDENLRIDVMLPYEVDQVFTELRVGMSIDELLASVDLEKIFSTEDFSNKTFDDFLLENQDAVKQMKSNIRSVKEKRKNSGVSVEQTLLDTDGDYLLSKILSDEEKEKDREEKRLAKQAAEELKRQEAERKEEEKQEAIRLKEEAKLKGLEDKKLEAERKEEEKQEAIRLKEEEKQEALRLKEEARQKDLETREEDKNSKGEAKRLSKEVAKEQKKLELERKELERQEAKRLKIESKILKNERNNELEMERRLEGGDEEGLNDSSTLDSFDKKADKKAQKEHYLKVKKRALQIKEAALHAKRLENEKRLFETKLSKEASKAKSDEEKRLNNEALKEKALSSSEKKEQAKLERQAMLDAREAEKKAALAEKAEFLRLKDEQNGLEKNQKMIAALHVKALQENVLYDKKFNRIRLLSEKNAQKLKQRDDLLKDKESLALAKQTAKEIRQKLIEDHEEQVTEVSMVIVNEELVKNTKRIDKIKRKIRNDKVNKTMINLRVKALLARDEQSKHQLESEAEALSLEIKNAYEERLNTLRNNKFRIESTIERQKSSATKISKKEKMAKKLNDHQSEIELQRLTADKRLEAVRKNDALSEDEFEKLKNQVADKDQQRIDDLSNIEALDLEHFEMPPHLQGLSDKEIRAYKLKALEEQSPEKIAAQIAKSAMKKKKLKKEGEQITLEDLNKRKENEISSIIQNELKLLAKFEKSELRRIKDNADNCTKQDTRLAIQHLLQTVRLRRLKLQSLAVRQELNKKLEYTDLA